MSVAFRRESDEEHLEPKFEIPIPPGPNLLTARGLALTEAKVAELEAATRAAADDEKLKRELRYWRTRLATAQIVAAPDGDAVAFGCTVTFRQGGRERTISIVGDDEADPKAGLLSFSAPLVRAMMDAGEGEVVPFGEQSIEVVEIRPLDG